MFFAVNKTQKKFHEQIRDLDGKVNNTKDRVSKVKDRSQDGEYIDYEEIK